MPDFIAKFCFALLLLLPVTARAQTVDYEIYAGGINALEATFDMDLAQKDRYDLFIDAKTRGLLARLAPWEGTFETRGWRLKDRLQPELHKSVAMWRGEPDIKEYHYNRDGTFGDLIITDDKKKNEIESVDRTLTNNSTDVLSATLEMMERLVEDPTCKGSSEIFDGDRRFRLTFKHQGEEVLVPTKYNSFGGPTVKCEVEVSPLAGKWHEKPRGWMSIQEQGRLRGSLPVIWMGQVEQGGPVVPVKVRVKTDYGTLFLHMVGYKNG